MKGENHTELEQRRYCRKVLFCDQSARDECAGPFLGDVVGY